MLLSYREEYIQQMHNRVTYVTGKFTLDCNTSIWLKNLLKSPSTIIRDKRKAKPIALKLVSSFAEKYGLLQKLQIQHVHAQGRVHVRFALRNLTSSHV